MALAETLSVTVPVGVVVLALMGYFIYHIRRRDDQRRVNDDDQVFSIPP